MNGARREIEREIFLDFCKLLELPGPACALFSPAATAPLLPGLAEGISATAVAWRNTDLLLRLDWLVARLMADWPALPCSLSLELTELVTLPGIFFLEITCRALPVVAVLPVLFSLPAPCWRLYLFFRATASLLTLELEWPEY